MEGKFNPGDVVYTRTNAMIKLIVKRSVNCIYFCSVQTDSKQREQVYFERELVLAAEPEKHKAV